MPKRICFQINVYMHFSSQNNQKNCSNFSAPRFLVRYLLQYGNGNQTTYFIILTIPALLKIEKLMTD